jgi:hypothetical protein
MRQHINTYIQGMDKDTSKQKYANSKYANGLNIRPVTDKGFSTGALENIKGNKYLADIPQIGYSLVLEAKEENELDPTTTYNYGLTIHSIASNIIINTTITFSSYDELFEGVESALSALPTTYSVNKLKDENRIVIYSPTTIVAYNYNQTDNYIDWEIRQPFSDFVIIGHTHLRDRTILFTKNLIGDTDFGQIWEKKYDIKDPFNTADVELLYNERLNFSLDHPIKALSRYETQFVQRIYWTDNFNKPKQLNIAREDVLAVRVSDTLLNPEVQLQPALVQSEESTTGTLPAGLWYVTYKLQKENGNLSPIAPFNNPTPVFIDTVGVGGGDTNYEDVNYTSGQLITNKSLNYTIPEIPKGFDKIIIYAVLEDQPGAYLAYQIKTEYIDTLTNFTFQLNSIDNAIQTTTDEILIYDIDFETVKTLLSKDNTLLYANTTSKSFVVDYDARAYRFKPFSLDTYVTIDTSDTKNWGVGLTDDVINPMNRDSTAYGSWVLLY